MIKSDARHHNPEPWKFLEPYRGKLFNGEWPTVTEMFDIATERFPERNSFVCFAPKHVAYTYKESRQIVMSIAAKLRELGAKTGDKIAVTGKNSPEWGLAYLGALYAGCIIVPIDNAMHENEIENLLSFAEVKIAFMDADRIGKIDPENKILTAKISLEPGPDFLLDVIDRSKHFYEKVDENEVAAILFTSGTTGTPKGVMLTHKNVMSDAYLSQGLMNIDEDEVFYALLPIHHAYTMQAVFFEAMTVSSCIVFGKKMVISQVFKDMREGHVTMFLGVPMLFNKLITGMMKGIREKGIIVYGLVRALMGFSGFVKKVFKVNIGKKLFGSVLDKVALRDNRICICGGGPLPDSTFRHFNEFGIDFVQGYGMTETSPIVTLNPVFDYNTSSVGHPVPGCEIKIVDPDENGNGLIYVRGPMVMKGYYKNQEATDEIIDKDGWLNSGDIGHLDQNNFLILTGRAKNVIVNEGGKNIFPEEIEDMFQLYDEIDQILVTSFVEDKATKSEGIAAIIHPSDAFKKSVDGDKDKMTARFEEIVETENKKLLAYKRIKKIVIADEPMETSSTKKIKRYIAVKKYNL